MTTQDPTVVLTPNTKQKLMLAVLEKHRLSCEALAVLIGRHERTVYRWKTGDNVVPSALVPLLRMLLRLERIPNPDATEV